MAIEPVVYGASERAPRGDYSRAAANYTCPQNPAAYTAADHDTFRRLFGRVTRDELAAVDQGLELFLGLAEGP